MRPQYLTNEIYILSVSFNFLSLQIYEATVAIFWRSASCLELKLNKAHDVY